MKTNQLLPSRVGVVILILSICLTASSVRYQGPSPSFCYGNLAAGFPLRFICDTDAESPTTSWEKIDGADAVRLQPTPFLINVVFYALAAWVAWVLVRVLVRLRHRHLPSKQE